MKIQPTQSRPAAQTQPVVKASVPKGVSSVPDRLEPHSFRREEEPPSQFKKFLFDPIVFVISFVFKGLLQPIVWLKDLFFETPPIMDDPSLKADRNFRDRLALAPRAEEIFIQFERHFSEEERAEIYRIIGSKYSGKLSWKEYIWHRSAYQNINLGHRLVRNNPERVRDCLTKRIKET